MKRIVFEVVLVAAVLTGFSFIGTGNWKIGEKHSITFSGRSVSGGFSSLKGEILFDENNLEASGFDVIIDASSIFTGNDLKTKHAKGEDWFDVVKYPAIRFKSGKVSKNANGYETTGTLDMHGVQKQITIPFTFKNNVFNGSFTIKRSDFNLGSTNGFFAYVAPVLTVDISVPVIR